MARRDQSIPYSDVDDDILELGAIPHRHLFSLCCCCFNDDPVSLQNQQQQQQHPTTPTMIGNTKGHSSSRKSSGSRTSSSHHIHNHTSSGGGSSGQGEAFEHLLTIDVVPQSMSDVHRQYVSADRRARRAACVTIFIIAFLIAATQWAVLASSVPIFVEEVGLRQHTAATCAHVCFLISFFTACVVSYRVASADDGKVKPLGVCLVFLVSASMLFSFFASPIFEREVKWAQIMRGITLVVYSCVLGASLSTVTVIFGDFFLLTSYVDREEALHSSSLRRSLQNSESNKTRNGEKNYGSQNTVVMQTHRSPREETERRIFVDHWRSELEQQQSLRPVLGILFYSTMQGGALIGRLLFPFTHVQWSWFAAVSSFSAGLAFLATLLFLVNHNTLHYVQRVSHEAPELPSGVFSYFLRMVILRQTKVEIEAHLLALRNLKSLGMSTGTATSPAIQSSNTSRMIEMVDISYLLKEINRVAEVSLVLPPLIIFWAAFFQMFVLWYAQTNMMDLSLGGGLNLRPEQATVLCPLAGVFLTFVYLGVARCMQSFCSFDVSLHSMPRMFLGFAMAIVAYGCGYYVQGRIEHEGVGKVSVWMQVPQFVAMCFAEVLLHQSAREVSYNNTPTRMRPLVDFVHWLLIALGMVINVIVSASVDVTDSDRATSLKYHFIGYLGALAGGLLWFLYTAQSFAENVPPQMTVSESTFSSVSRIDDDAAAYGAGLYNTDPAIHPYAAVSRSQSNSPPQPSPPQRASSSNLLPTTNNAASTRARGSSLSSTPPMNNDSLTSGGGERRVTPRGSSSQVVYYSTRKSPRNSFQ